MNNSSLGIVYIILGLVECIICGFITRHISESKGYEGGFAWGFWLNILGIIVVACKPDNRQYSQKEYIPKYSPQARQQEKKWRCGNCGTENPDSLNYCLGCRADRNAVQAKKVKCPHCGALNNETNSSCFACHKSLSEKSEPTNEKPAQTSSPEKDSITLIKQLAELHSQGILSDEEFESKKAELLAKM